MSWWHAYGRVVDLSELFPSDDGKAQEPAPIWQLIVVGPTPLDTEAIRAAWKVDPDVPYLTSWDHEPSNTEKGEITPEEYRDEEADELSDALGGDPDGEG